MWEEIRKHDRCITNHRMFQPEVHTQHETHPFIFPWRQLKIRGYQYLAFIERSLCIRLCSKHFNPSNYFNEIGAIIVPILQMRKLRLRERKAPQQVTDWTRPQNVVFLNLTQKEGSWSSECMKCPRGAFRARLWKLF